MNVHPAINVRKLETARHIVTVILLISAFPPFIGNVLAATNWPSDMKSLYIDSCTQNIVATGMMEYWSGKYCSCLADGMEKEFGTEEYQQMRQSKPNANGSALDRRLYIVFDICKDRFPKKKHPPGSPFQ